MPHLENSVARAVKSQLSLYAAERKTLPLKMLLCSVAERYVVGGSAAVVPPTPHTIDFQNLFAEKLLSKINTNNYLQIVIQIHGYLQLITYTPK